MMNVQPRVAALLLAFALASCAAKDGATPLVPSSASGQNGALAFAGAQKTDVVLRIVVPRPARPPRGRYISPSTQSLVFVVTQNDAPIKGGSGYANLTPESPQCRGGSGSTPLICTVNIPLIVAGSGNFTFAIATFDAVQSGPATQAPCALPDTHGCAGALLSANVVVEMLTQGIVNTVGFTLGGVPASLVVTPVSPGYLRGGGSPPKLDIWGRDAQEAIVQALDADGSAIVGPGAPSYSVASENPSQLTARTVPSKAPNIVALQAVTSGYPPVVSPGIVVLDVAVTPAAGGGITVSFGVPVTIAHSIVYVSTPLNGVNGYYDGNTQPSARLNQLLWIDLQGIAVGRNGEIYFANPAGGDVIECPSGSTSSRGCRRAFKGLGVDVTGLAIDTHGNLSIANASRVYKCPPGSSSLRACSALAFDDANGIAIGANDNLSIVSSQSNARGNGVWSCPRGATNQRQCTRTTVSAMKPVSFGVAVETLAGYVSSFSAVGRGSVLKCTPGWTKCSLSYAGDKPRGIALDANGALYVADGGAGKIEMCPPTILNSCRPLISLRHPAFVTVVPGPL
jgi:hypothetical protein